MKKATIIGITLGVVAIIIIVLLTRTQPLPLDNYPTLNLKAAAWTDHVINGSSTIVVEYSDYECPACAASDPIIKAAIKNTSATFIYRHFPLKKIHKYSTLAAQAAEAAGLQGKFWEMHTALFENQAAWAGENDPTPLFLLYAQEVGLDISRFTTDLNSVDVRAKVENDYNSAWNELQLHQTPTVFVNGKKITWSTQADLINKIQSN